MQTNLSNQATNSNQLEFLVGDVVVHVSANASDALFTVIAYQPNDHYWLESDYLLHKSNIRHATLAEIQAKRRLPQVDEMGDDAYIENHISPHCQTGDHLKFLARAYYALKEVS